MEFSHPLYSQGASSPGSPPNHQTQLRRMMPETSRISAAIFGGLGVANQKSQASYHAAGMQRSEMQRKFAAWSGSALGTE